MCLSASFCAGLPVVCVLTICRTSYRLWQQSEVAEDSSSQLPPNPVADTFAQLMTALYAKLQSEAGACALCSCLGIERVAAWRALTAQHMPKCSCHVSFVCAVCCAAVCCR